jgi:hypothetical protein
VKKKVTVITSTWPPQVPSTAATAVVARVLEAALAPVLLAPAAVVLMLPDDGSIPRPSYGLVTSKKMIDASWMLYERKRKRESTI